MRPYLTFDDVLIEPRFSEVISRKDVNISTRIGKHTLDIPVFSANMDTITGKDMAIAMASSGARGVLHRFSTIEENVKDFLHISQHCGRPVAVSVGIGQKELERAKELYKIGADMFFIDVAHGAQLSVVQHYAMLRESFLDADIIVGNFATSESIAKFISKCEEYNVDIPTAFKVGIGPGSACTTRVKTGVGIPQLQAIIDCAKNFSGHDAVIIADGGMKTPGDIAKALAAGADAVMLGGMFAGCDETPGNSVTTIGGVCLGKKYRGSASASSYKDQGKNDNWRTAEGQEFFVASKGPVENVLKDISGGLRSAFSYTGSKDLKEFQEVSKFVVVTSSGKNESIAHGDPNAR